MNGAVTIGTLDGANAEIRDAVGAEQFFLFGLTVEQVAQWKAGGYAPASLYSGDPELKETIDLIASGAFSRGDRELFRPLLDSLLSRDELYSDIRELIRDLKRNPWKFFWKE